MVNAFPHPLEADRLLPMLYSPIFLSTLTVAFEIFFPLASASLLFFSISCFLRRSSSSFIWPTSTCSAAARSCCIANASRGARATLVGLRAKGWPKKQWQTDAALIDGCLQLALLWGLEVSGGQSLPMRVGEFVQYGSLPEGEVTCELVKRSASSQRTVSDIRVWDENGKPLLDLRGVEMYVVPGGTASGN